MIQIMAGLIVVSGILALLQAGGGESVDRQAQRKKKTGVSSGRACTVFGLVQILLGAGLLLLTVI